MWCLSSSMIIVLHVCYVHRRCTNLYKISMYAFVYEFDVRFFCFVIFMCSSCHVREHVPLKLKKKRPNCARRYARPVISIILYDNSVTYMYAMYTGTLQVTYMHAMYTHTCMLCTQVLYRLHTCMPCTHIHVCYVHRCSTLLPLPPPASAFLSPNSAIRPARGEKKKHMFFSPDFKKMTMIPDFIVIFWKFRHYPSSWWTKKKKKKKKK